MNTSKSKSATAPAPNIAPSAAHSRRLGLAFRYGGLAGSTTLRVAELAQGLRRAWGPVEDDRRRIARAARETVTVHFSWDRTVDSVDAGYIRVRRIGGPCGACELPPPASPPAVCGLVLCSGSRQETP